MPVPPAWLLAIAAVAFLVRLVPLLRGGGLFGIIDYDDGVYFGSAVAWVAGRVPYRDFLLLHPPGMIVLLAPIAALGGVVGDPTAFALARLAMMGLGAVNAVLVTLVASRAGRIAGLAAGALYAVWQVPANVERTTWLIAPQTTCLLLALLLAAGLGAGRPLTSRRAALIGVLAGLATSVQLWGALIAVVLGGWLLLTARAAGGWARAVVAYAAGAAAAFGALVLPFLVASGGTLVRYVVEDQLGRHGATRVPLITRLRAIEGLPATPTGGTLGSTLVALGFVAVVIVVAFAAWRRRELRLWAALLAAQTTFLLAGPVFFGHYTGWLAAAAALSIGGAVAFVVDVVRDRQRLRRAVLGVYAAGLAALVLGAAVHRTGARLDRAELTRLVADARCVTADTPTLLIESDTLRRNVERGCALRLDPTGTSYDTDRAMPPGVRRTRPNQPEYQQTMLAYYGASDAALFMRLRSGDGFRPETWAAIRAELPIERRLGPIVIRLRTPPAAGR